MPSAEVEAELGSSADIRQSVSQSAIQSLSRSVRQFLSWVELANCAQLPRFSNPR